MSDLCTEIEELQLKHDAFDIHKKIQKPGGPNNRQRSNTLNDEN